MDWIIAGLGILAGVMLIKNYFWKSGTLFYLGMTVTLIGASIPFSKSNYKAIGGSIVILAVVVLVGNMIYRTIFSSSNQSK